MRVKIEIVKITCKRCDGRKWLYTARTNPEQRTVRCQRCRGKGYHKRIRISVLKNAERKVA